MYSFMYSDVFIFTIFEFLFEIEELHQFLCEWISISTGRRIRRLLIRDEIDKNRFVANRIYFSAILFFPHALPSLPSRVGQTDRRWGNGRNGRRPYPLPPPTEEYVILPDVPQRRRPGFHLRPNDDVNWRRRVHGLPVRPVARRFALTQTTTVVIADGVVRPFRLKDWRPSV